jgi:hypothetical protein
MKRKYSDFTEVQLDVSRHQITPDWVGADKMFTVRLPEGARVAVYPSELAHGAKS